jgi:cell division protein FtsZ
MLKLVDATTHKIKMKVIGIGGAGVAAVNRMISADLEGVGFVVANTDATQLNVSPARIKIQLGMKLTRGFGTSGNINLGKRAAIKCNHLLRRHLNGADMIFIVAGLGGGTGTAGTPVVAEVCKNLGALTIAVVTKPFLFEGKVRNERAKKGIAELRRIVDTLIVIPNQHLIDFGTGTVSLQEVFEKADDTLVIAVKSIVDLILESGHSVDFADIKTIMSYKGLALFGTSAASGEHRVIEATQKAISSRLMEDNSIHGAQGVLLNITGGPNFSLSESHEALTLVRDCVNENAHIIMGTIIDENMKDEIRVTIIATGIEDDAQR